MQSYHRRVFSFYRLFLYTYTFAGTNADAIGGGRGNVKKKSDTLKRARSPRDLLHAKLQSDETSDSQLIGQRDFKDYIYLTEIYLLLKCDFSGYS